MELVGKVAIVTGSGQGIGRAIALKLAQKGADVAVADIIEETAEKVAEEVRSKGRKSIAIKTDITDMEQVTAMSGKVLDEFGSIDILVNNAGWDRAMPFIETTPDFWEKVWAINLKGPVQVTRSVLDHMIEKKSGKIINISSDAGRVGSSGETVYASAKGGIIAFTKSLAREMARYGINVNCVCPGPTDTPLFQQLGGEKLKEALIKAIPFRRLAKPEEIAGAVAFFASPDADYITGQVLSVSGGLTMVG